jgi:adenine/guanine phosphoribosyltransferase-like PRPP-binding protein
MKSKEQLAYNLLEAAGFLIEEETDIDGIIYPCRPIYIEYVYLYPVIFERIAKIIANGLLQFKPTLIMSMESAVLPLSTYIASILKIPFSVVRKPNYKGHEKNEPKIFLNDSLYENDLSNCIFFDDAIWSGKSTTDIFALTKDNGFSVAMLVYLIDFLEFSAVRHDIPHAYWQQIENRFSFLTYEELLNFAVKKNYINTKTFEDSIKLKRKD